MTTETPVKTKGLRDADLLYRLVREMVLLHHQGDLSQEEHEWAEEQWVFKALAALNAIGSDDEITITGILSSFADVHPEGCPCPECVKARAEFDAWVEDTRRKWHNPDCTATSCGPTCRVGRVLTAPSGLLMEPVQ